MKVEALREMIRKEIRSVIREEFGNYLSEVFSKPKQSSAGDISLSSMVSENVEEHEPIASHEPKKFVKYTNNDLLNQVLNETKGGVPQEGGGMVSIEGQVDSISSVLNESAVKDAPEPVKTVAKAINRDYSSLMKAIDKKRTDKK